jgi:hypothetical protein
MILLTCFYSDSHRARREEFLYCMQRNCCNPMIDALHVFIEDQSDPARLLAILSLPGNIRFTPWGRRMTFQELFDYANRNFAGRDVIIANGDIYFDQTLQRLRGHDLSGKLLCMSRWNVRSDGTAHLFDHPASQDAWIFRAPVHNLSCNFPLGVPASDNRLAWEARRVGIEVSNPARSIRAYHVHLSGVRRYVHHDRLPGPVASVPPGFLGTPWLWFVICGGGNPDRAWHTAEALVDYPRASCLLVEASPVVSSGLCAAARRLDISVIAVPHLSYSQGAQARSDAIAFVDPDGILCFVDDHVLPAANFSDFVLSELDETSFLLPDENVLSASTPLVCKRAHFDRAGGFDRNFQGWGEEVIDLADALRRIDVAPQTIPEALLLPLVSSSAHQLGRDRGQNQDARRGVHASYRRAKAAILDECGGGHIAPATLAEIYRAVRLHKLKQAAACPHTPLADIAFYESMGYSIAHLEFGESSHNNDRRPFKSIPAPLRGLPFTQVVACNVSIVEVEFLSEGKLYILVGTDWYGHDIASAWLTGVGYRESLPPLETERGTTFEVWSLAGHTGEVIVLPTQVMLVAATLDRQERSA